MQIRFTAKVRTAAASLIDLHFMNILKPRVLLKMFLLKKKIASRFNTEQLQM